MEQIKLNKANPEMEFKLNSKDSYLLIHSVFVDPEGRFIDDRKKQFAIHFNPDLYQVQPVFHLNTLIKNETFTLGVNPEQKFYRTLKLELQDVESLDEDYSLEFNIEKFNTDA